jgi:hypothetical protein
VHIGSIWFYIQGAIMQRRFAMLGIVVFALACWTVARAAEAKKPVTLTGTLECAHCVLHEGTECKDVLMVKENGKDVRYDVTLTGDAKGKHVCQGTKQAKVTGIVTEKDGKKTLTATKVEDVKP